MNEVVERAVAVLQGGGLVAFPTETVYGLGADASNADAVRRVFAAKGRPADHPLIVHLAARDQLDGWASEVPNAAARLADAFWPGPLTVLVPRAGHVLNEVTGGRDTVAVRVPAHPLALELLDGFGGGVVAPSANRFGRVSPTTAAAVAEELEGAVDLILDGGPCSVGVESTIVDCTVSPPQILRAGGITPEAVGEILGDVAFTASGPSRAPGMLASHYAPRCAVRLVESPHDAERVSSTETASGYRVEILDTRRDLEESARRLYGWLRSADARGVDVLVVVLPEARGLGYALRDRLSKAAAPR